MRLLERLQTFRPRVTPDPAATKALEEKLARIVPPEGGFLKDRVQRREDHVPALLRRQAG